MSGLGKIELREWVGVYMNFGGRNMISTFQNHVGENVAVKRVSLLFPRSDRSLRVSRRVIQSPLGCIRQTYEDGWI